MNGRVEVVVYHETPDSLPPDPVAVESQPVPAQGFSPHHFSAYYTLFGGPVPTLLPRFWGKYSECPPLANPCEPLPPDMGGVPFYCLVGGVGGG